MMFQPAKILGVLVLVIINLVASSQNTVDDLNLLLDNDPSVIKYHKHDAKFGIANNRNAIIKYNPLTLSLSTLMYTYQRWVSPQISSNCYFEPTCSRYSKVLYQNFGLIKGTLATADRLMRCDRISATTFHPITISHIDGKIHESHNRYRFHEVHTEHHNH